MAAARSSGLRILALAGQGLLAVVLRVMPTMVIILVLNFVLLQLAPGDVADVIAAESGSATAATMAALRHRLGLDLSPVTQFGHYVWGILHLNLGYSSRFSMPVLDLIMSRLTNTLILMASALTIAVIFGILSGVVMASRVGRLTDRVLSVVVLIFYSVPSFWGALMFIVIFSVELGWLPSTGNETVGIEGSVLVIAADIAAHLVLPAISLALLFMAIFARITRASMLDVLRQDYVRTASAKGLSRRRVMFFHVLRNALIPVTTIAGVNFGLLLGGAIVTETVFAWPGLGTLSLQAVLARDYPVLLGILLLSSLLVIVANILTDLLHGRLDPRIRRHA